VDQGSENVGARLANMKATHQPALPGLAVAPPKDELWSLAPIHFERGFALPANVVAGRGYVTTLAMLVEAAAGSLLCRIGKCCAATTKAPTSVIAVLRSTNIRHRRSSHRLHHSQILSFLFIGSFNFLSLHRLQTNRIRHLVQGVT
jgi:hypothetical protein